MDLSAKVKATMLGALFLIVSVAFNLTFKNLIVLFYFMCLNFKGFYVFRTATTVTTNRTYLKHSVSSFMIILI